MEQNTSPVIFAKKVWRLVRVLYFMLRKNISNSKLFVDLNRMMKRRKIAGKSTHNLMFHHNANSPPSAGEYEFSCSNSPSTNNQPFSLFSFQKKHQFIYSVNKQMEDHDDMIMAVSAAAMEMINHGETPSPALGFRRRPVRVTDSPFPDEDCHVDEAAERFITRFYNDLRGQNTN